MLVAKFSSPAVLGLPTFLCFSYRVTLCNLNNYPRHYASHECERLGLPVWYTHGRNTCTYCVADQFQYYCAEFSAVYFSWVINAGEGYLKSYCLPFLFSEYKFI